MATVIFETEKEELPKIKAVLKALGVTQLKVKNINAKMSKSDFIKKLDEARQEKGEILTEEMQKELFN